MRAPPRPWEAAVARRVDVRSFAGATAPRRRRPERRTKEPMHGTLLDRPTADPGSTAPSPGDRIGMAFTGDAGARRQRVFPLPGRPSRRVRDGLHFDEPG